MSLFSSIISILTLATVSLPLASGATFDVPPFPKAIEAAPVIVRGTIGMSYADSAKDADGVQRIFTFYEVQISEVIKGNISNPTLMMREMGGVKDGMSTQITGTAQFSRGEDVVVFLKNINADHSYDLQEMMLGKYNIQTDATGQEYLEGAGLIETGVSSQWSIQGLKDEIRRQESISQEPPQPIKPLPLAKTEPLRLFPSAGHPELGESKPHINNDERTNSDFPLGIGFVLYAAIGAVTLFGVYLLASKKA